MMGAEPPGRLRWAVGTTITRDDGTALRVSVPSLGRAWRMDRRTWSTLLRWVADPAGPEPVLIRRLVSAGLLVEGEVPESDDGPWSPVRRFQAWVAHDLYRDGADRSGAVRHDVMEQFGDDDVERMRQSPVRAQASAQIFPSHLAEIVWQATSRVRANRARVRSAVDANALLFSYGAAHELIVAVAASPGSLVAWADLDRNGHGHPIPADPAAVLDGAGVGASCAVILVVGTFGDYQRRYHHDKAMRGFLVDGGRLLGEVSRIAAARCGEAVVTYDVPSPGLGALLNLDADQFVAGAVGMR